MPASGAQSTNREQNHEGQMKCLATFFDVPLDVLRDEFFRVLPVARQKFLHINGISNAGAWQNAIWHLCLRDKTKFTVLRKILSRMLVYTNSSCGVEQNFSKARFGFRSNRSTIDYYYYYFYHYYY